MASGLGLSGNRLWEQIERAGGGAHLGGGDAQIAGRGSQAAMTQQQLDGAHVGARIPADELRTRAVYHDLVIEDTIPGSGLSRGRWK